MTVLLEYVTALLEDNILQPEVDKMYISWKPMEPTVHMVLYTVLQ